MRHKVNIAIVTILTLFILGVLSACTPSDNHIEAEDEGTIKEEAGKAEYRRISADEAYQIMNEADNYILLDVRTEEEYNEKHIKGAVLIPDYEINTRAGKELTDKDMLILVYCRSGRRSAAAAQALAEMGYTAVCDFGGIINWTYDVEENNK